MPTAIHTFAEERRAWIAAHAGILLFQKRRAELLGKQIRARDRARVGVRPDPHDDDVTPPLVFRQTSTATGGFETAIVAVCAIAAPLGWPLGRLLYGWITTLIPERLLGYPIPALFATAAVCGFPLPLLYEPSPSVWSVIVVPWLFAQIPAVFLTAGIYGVLEGWLAVEGSSHWWPLTPVAAELDDEFFLGGRDVAMPTLLDPPSHEPEPLAVPRVGAATIRWIPLLCSGIPAGLGILWYCWLILSALLHLPGEWLNQTVPVTGPSTGDLVG
jgi:hypothetical protein